MSEWSDWYRREDPTGWVLPAILRTRAAEHPDRDFMRFGGGPWLSYAEIDLRTNRVANALLARGLRKGEAVSTVLPNVEQNLAAWFGIQRAGGVQCPVNLAYRGRFLSWVLNLPQSRFLIIGDDHLAWLDAVKDEELPETLRKLPPAQRSAMLDEKLKTRATLNAKLARLVARRDAFVAEQRAKAPPKQSSFDRVVEETLKKQIAR